MRLVDIKPYERNAKVHDEVQIENIMKSITDFGMVQPIVVDADGVIIIGHCRYEAMKRLGFENFSEDVVKVVEVAGLNEVLLLVTLVLYFGFLVLMHRLFKANGVFAFIAIASIMANMELCIGTSFLGVPCTLGNVAFSSIFLALDILNEGYGERTASQGVKTSVLTMAFVVAISSVNKLFETSSSDLASQAYRALFEFSPRINLCSLLCFWLATSLNVRLFAFFKRRTKGRMLWVRNNASTILTNCTENLLFYTMAFAGIMSWEDIFRNVGVATSLELFIALCDTPFLYRAVGRKEKPCH